MPPTSNATRHDEHEFDSWFESWPDATNSSEFVHAVNSYDLYVRAYGNPHPDPEVQRRLARLVVSAAKYGRGAILTDDDRAYLADAPDEVYDEALSRFRDAMSGEPPEATEEFITNRVVDVLNERALAGTYREATLRERSTYQRYVVDGQVPMTYRDAQAAQALLSETNTIEGQEIRPGDRELIDSASESDVLHAFRDALAFTAKYREFASADQLGDTTAGFLRDRMKGALGKQTHGAA